MYTTEKQKCNFKEKKKNSTESKSTLLKNGNLQKTFLLDAKYKTIEFFFFFLLLLMKIFFQTYVALKTK